jgi:hypothetical protein
MSFVRESFTNQWEGLVCFDNGHLVAQHYFHIAMSLCLPFLLFLPMKE